MTTKMWVALSVVSALCGVGLFLELQTPATRIFGSLTPLLVLVAALLAIFGGWASCFWAWREYGAVTFLGGIVAGILFVALDMSFDGTVVDHNHELPYPWLAALLASLLLGAGIVSTMTVLVEAVTRPRRHHAV